MNDPVPSSAIYDATVGGLSLIVVAGGSTGDVLTLQANGTYAPATPSAASGNVVGPASSTDNAIARYDATTGKLLQNSAGILDDNGKLLINVSSSFAQWHFKAGSGGALLAIEPTTNNAAGIYFGGNSGDFSNSLIRVGNSFDMAFATFGTMTHSGRWIFAVSTATHIPVIVKGAASQSANLQEWQNSAGTVKALINAAGGFSNTGGQTNSEIFGSGATVGAGTSVAIGRLATAGGSQGDSVVIGYNAQDSANGRNVIIGAGASATGAESAVAIGRNATVTTSSSVVIGSGAAGQISIGANAVSGASSVAIGASATTATAVDAVVIGNAASATQAGTAVGKGATADAGGDRGSVAVGFNATNATFYGTAIGRGTVNTSHYEFVGGGSDTPDSKRTDIYFGNGVVNTAPVAVTYHGTGGSGTNIVGANIAIAGGKGTGTGTPGCVVIQTSVAGSSGATPQTLSDACKFDGNTTSGETRMLLLDIDAGTLKRVSIGSADSGGTGFKVLRVPN